MPPAISLYAPGKPSPMAPAFLDTAREHWRRAIHEATVAIIIGARVVNDDKHVWAPIYETGCEVWYVGTPVGPDFLHFQATMGNRLTMFADTFEAAVFRLDTRLRILS